MLWTKVLLPHEQCQPAPSKYQREHSHGSIHREASQEVPGSALEQLVHAEVS